MDYRGEVRVLTAKVGKALMQSARAAEVLVAVKAKAAELARDAEGTTGRCASTGAASQAAQRTCHSLTSKVQKSCLKCIKGVAINRVIKASKSLI